LQQGKRLEKTAIYFIGETAGQAVEEKKLIYNNNLNLNLNLKRKKQLLILLFYF
jgi:hypothetical protein